MSTTARRALIVLLALTGVAVPAVAAAAPPAPAAASAGTGRAAAHDVDGTTATPNGLLPVAMVATTWSVAVSMTDNVLAPWSVT